MGRFRKRVKARRALAAHRVEVRRHRRRAARAARPVPAGAARSFFARAGDAVAFALGRLVLLLRVPFDALLEAVEDVAVRTHGLLFLRRRSGEAPAVPGFLVVGHRGSPAKRVENTLPSFEEALAVDGANALEMDLCVTKDGEVVIWHDFDPDDLKAVLRQAGVESDVKHKPVVPPVGSGQRRPICDLPLPELRAHFGYAEEEGGERVAATIPTFAEFAAWAAPRTDLAVVFLDVKVPAARVDLVPALVAGVDAALARHPGRYEVVYLTPEEPVLRAIRARSPSAARSLDVVVPSGLVLFPSRYSAVRKAIELSDPCATVGRPTMTISGWSVYRRIVEDDLALLTRHNAGRPAKRVERLVAWTVNDPRELRTLVRLGVHGILTDHPERLREIARA